MPNEDKYQKSGQLFRYRLGVSKFKPILLITWIFTEETDFKISHFATYGPLWPWPLTLDWVIWHTIAYHSWT